MHTRARTDGCYCLYRSFFLTCFADEISGRRKREGGRIRLINVSDGGRMLMAIASSRHGELQIQSLLGFFSFMRARGAMIVVELNVPTST